MLFRAMIWTTAARPISKCCIKIYAISRRGAVLRAQQPAMALADALTLAAAQTAGKILITRNTKDFPAEMPGIRVPYTL